MESLVHYPAAADGVYQTGNDAFDPSPNQWHYLSSTERYWISAFQELQNQFQQLEEQVKDLFREQQELKKETRKMTEEFQNELENLRPAQEGNFQPNIRGSQDSEDFSAAENPYYALKAGTRITVIDPSGTAQSGIFLEETEREIIWVSSCSNEIKMTNKKGITVSKDT